MKLFKKFKDLFSISQNKKTDKETACIKYYTCEDGIKIDITLDDDSEKHIENLAYLINTIGRPTSFKETMSIIEQFFIMDNKSEELFLLYSKLDKSIVENRIEDNEKNNPYIRPSDMLQ
mgnify:CR=1 FL=1